MMVERVQDGSLFMYRRPIYRVFQYLETFYLLVRPPNDFTYLVGRKPPLQKCLARVGLGLTYFGRKN
uniref:Uncharacterized protein n=1 Tax=Timema bartmani TaxID=61472 RepID=A0A7R9ETG9_9NEOP|nr:unnamed protein product [Timema bartmani]